MLIEVVLTDMYWQTDFGLKLIEMSVSIKL